MAAHDLEHLRTFLTVYRAGSVSEAARLLGVSQPTASSHVQALERRLGLRLFDRTPTGTRATARADELAQAIAVHLDALEDATELPPELAAGTLHLGGPAEYLCEVVAPRMPELVEAARVPLRLHLGLADDLVERLRVGDLDVVVSAVRPRARGVTAVPLADEEFVLVAAPRWADGFAGETGTLAELERVPVVAYSESLPIVRRYWRSVFGHRPDALETCAVVPDLRGVRAALVAGVGMSALPRYLVAAELASGALVEVHVPDVAPLNTVYLATRTGAADRRRTLRELVAAITRIAATS